MRLRTGLAQWAPGACTHKTGYNCGYVLDDLPLSVRERTCPECGVVHKRPECCLKYLRVGASNPLGEGSKTRFIWTSMDQNPTTLVVGVCQGDWCITDNDV